MSFTRRSFLKAATIAAASGVAIPQVVPSSVLGNGERAAAGERIAVGCIGTGHRGNAVMGEFMGQKDVQIVALCDVKAWALKETKERVDKQYGGNACATYSDFRKLLDRSDIDAVLVASTDHWHVLHSIAAARARKDVYMEKPMGLNMAECIALRKAMEENRRVFQFGTQQRSDGKFRLACELALNEKIGKLRTINVWSPGSSAGGSPEPAPVPEGLDYDMWLGPSPFKPHTQNRCDNSLWWFISDYALGFIAGWGIHPIDVAAWGAGEKLNSTVEVEGKGEFPKQGVADTAMNWRIKLKFENGLVIDFAGDPRPEEWTKRYPQSESHGTAFEGSEGWVHVNRAALNSQPASLVDAKIPENGIHLYRSPGHVRNFLDCVKSRAKTICPIDEAVRSETLCQISEIAIRLGRKVKWDWKTETFPDDEEANRKLKRAMRAPWTL